MVGEGDLGARLNRSCPIPGADAFAYALALWVSAQRRISSSPPVERVGVAEVTSEVMNMIRWGILGASGVAEAFASDLRLVPGAALLAVASRIPERAAAFASAYGAPRAYGSYEALVADPDIDVVYIATANAAHRDHCLLCLDGGKAVLCEKPFTVSAADARAVITKAREKHLFCMEAMWMRFIPLMRELPRLLESGAVGEVRMATIQLGFSNAVDPRRSIFNPATGGGSLLDLAVYPLSLASQLFGAPTRVDSQAIRGVTGVDEQVIVLLGYAGERQSVITASLRNATANDAVIMGTSGYVHIRAPLYSPTTLTLTQTPPISTAHATHSRLRKVYAKIKQYAPLRRPGQTRRLTRRFRGAGYFYEASEVVRCLRAGELESPIMPLDETARILDVVDGIRQRWAVTASYE
jgi:predicted dehydrogenase